MKYSIAFFFFVLPFISHGQYKHTKKIFSYVEEMPKPGFDLGSFLQKNLRYPFSVNEQVEGRTIVKFIVNEDGTISNCKIVTGHQLAAEVLRVVSKMPKWKPGKQNGKPVKVWFTLPITIDPEN